MENRFTKLQGQYLAFIVAYTKLNRRPPAEADLQGYFEVTPPSVHSMIVTLERRGLIRRRPGQARSLERAGYVHRPNVSLEGLPPGCSPSLRCAACGRRPYLHDDLEAIHLNANVVLTPPVTIWPLVERRVKLPPDVEEVVTALEHAV